MLNIPCFPSFRSVSLLQCISICFLFLFLVTDGLFSFSSFLFMYIYFFMSQFFSYVLLSFFLSLFCSSFPHCKQMLNADLYIREIRKPNARVFCSDVHIKRTDCSFLSQYQIFDHFEKKDLLYCPTQLSIRKNKPN